MIHYRIKATVGRHTVERYLSSVEEVTRELWSRVRSGDNRQDARLYAQHEERDDLDYPLLIDIQ